MCCPLIHSCIRANKTEAWFVHDQCRADSFTQGVNDSFPQFCFRDAVSIPISRRCLSLSLTSDRCLWGLAPEGAGTDHQTHTLAAACFMCLVDFLPRCMLQTPGEGVIPVSMVASQCSYGDLPTAWRGVTSVQVPFLQLVCALPELR